MAMLVADWRSAVSCLALQKEPLGVLEPDLKAAQVATLQSSSMGEVLLLDEALPRWTELFGLHHDHDNETSGLLDRQTDRCPDIAMPCMHAGSVAADIYGFSRVLWQIITGDTDAWTEAKMRLPRCGGA